MRLKFDKEKRITRVYSAQGHLLEGGESLIDPRAIIANETLAELESIIGETGKVFSEEAELWLCEKFYCLCMIDVLEVFGGRINNQQAIRDLLKAVNDLKNAFRKLDGEDEKALREEYDRKIKFGSKTSDQIYPHPLQTRAFEQGLRQLMDGKSGRGQPPKKETGIRRKAFKFGYEMFLKLGEEPTEVNNGFFGHFMRVLFNDPAMNGLEPLPANIKKMIAAAKKEVESEANHS